MKLSEALRLGEFALPPTNGAWIRLNNGVPCTACAIGRMCLAAGYRTRGSFTESESHLNEFISLTWPWTMKWAYREPTNINRDHKFYLLPLDTDNRALRVISNLYECAGWSMIQIADFVETIEPHEACDEPSLIEAAETVTAGRAV